MNLRKCLFLLALSSGFTNLCAQTNPAYLRYIEQYKDIAIEQMELYNIPASITLAQGLFESAAGQSQLSLRSNNHFGIKCGTGWSGRVTYHDDDARGECFRAYSTVRESYEDHSKFLKNRSRYASLFQLRKTDYKGWATGLKKAGYATNPQYANRLIDIIEKYRLFDFDTQSGRHHHHPDTPKLLAEKKWASIGISGTMREVKLVNGLLAVQARSGETISTIAKEYHIKTKRICKYNDVYDGYRLAEGEWVFLQAKKRYASKEYFRQRYVIKEGDSMHSISQEFGIKLKSLYKMNKLKPEDTMPKIGTPIRII